MKKSDWYQRRDDRQMRYAGRVLPHERPIVISLDPVYGRTFAGQVAAIVAANLFARMTPNLAFHIPKIEIDAALPWAGRDLADFIMSVSRSADPFAEFATRAPRDGDYVLTLGRGPAPACIHGAGWYAFMGPGESPIVDVTDPNPIGPAFAVIAAAGRLYGRALGALDGPYLFNTFRWNNELEKQPLPFIPNAELGRIWTVGAGSVGTAALYFLTLATHLFSSVTFDMDEVKIENLDRSPIFVAADASAKSNKSDAATAYLRSVGVADAVAEREPLDLSKRWTARQLGEPDLVIAAANERNVRYIIEQSCPPMQIYGTTGANWGASMIRHIPLLDACSCCVFPPDAQQAFMKCAEGQVMDVKTGHEVDAALPFLSFAAGLMAAAEVLKVVLPGYPFTPNRAVFSTAPQIAPRFTAFTTPQRVRCVCQDRSVRIHRRMISGTRYAHLSADVAAEAVSASLQ
jgi:ThiF family